MEFHTAMNKSEVLRCLGGARVQLDQMIKEIEADREDDGFPVFCARLPFVYRDLNRAWNRRAVDDETLLAMGREESERMCRFPDDLAPFVSD